MGTYKILVLPGDGIGSEILEGPGKGRRATVNPLITCGYCEYCRQGRDNLCEDVSGVMGFHLDGFARELVTMPARLVVKVPDGVSDTDAACDETT